MARRTLIVLGAQPDPPDLTGDRPRRDYEALIERLDADLLHPGALVSGTRRFGNGIALARVAASRASNYDAVYCDSEHIGFPLAYLLARQARRPRLTMIAHRLTPAKKRLTVRALRLQRKIDRIILHSPAQVALAHSLGFPPDAVELVPYQADADFWRADVLAQPTLISSAGQEFRDYLTILRAVDGLAAPVRIALGSNWSTRTSNFSEADVPSNTTIRWHSYRDLRQMYAESRVFVMPLHDSDFQAGISSVLEAMAMSKPVIITRTKGLTGVVTGSLMRDGALHDIGEHAWGEPTGMYVPAGDAAAMRAAIAWMLDHPDDAARMGAAGRRHVEAAFTLPRFAERVARIIAPDAANVAAGDARAAS